MKKMFALPILLLASMSTLTFAQDVSTDTSDSTTTEVTTTDTSDSTTTETTTDSSDSTTTTQEQIKESWKEFHENFGHAGLYLKRGMSTGDKVAAKAIVTARISSIEAINSEIKTKLKNKEEINWDEYKSEIAAIYETFKTGFTPYVVEDKLDEFEEFITEKISLINRNRGLRAENHQQRQNEKMQEKQNKQNEKMQEKQNRKVQKTSVKVGARAEKLRGVVEGINNIDILNVLVGKIDNLATKGINEETKTLLNDIKLLIQDKLGLLENNTTEESTDSSSDTTTDNTTTSE